MEKAAFVILAWNSGEHIQACVEAIFRLESFEAQILLVDNGSTDNTHSILEQLAVRCPFHCTVEIITYNKNVGTTVSRNAALKKVAPDVQYICLLDSDTQINENALRILAKELKEHADYGIVGPRMITSTGVIQVSGRKFPTITEKLLKAVPLKCAQRAGEKMQQPFQIQETGSHAVDYLMSACWWMRPELLQKVGMLDEKIFYAPEDAEYCIRVWKAGYKVAFCPKAQIIHEWQRLSKKKAFSRINWEHIKGLAYMFWKHKYLFGRP